MSIPVIDPFGVAGDQGMPSLALAINPAIAQQKFGRRLRRLTRERGFVHLLAIRVTRYKPERRCVIEYDVEVERPDLSPEAVTLIGKVRARRFGRSGHRLLCSLWDAGFHTDSSDGISVPEPVGTVGPFRMWLQRKVPGRVMTGMLTASGVALARQIAEAAHKLHRAGVRTERCHAMADELQILRECLRRVAQEHPHWERRIERLLAACVRLGAAARAPVPRGIHRDFYPDQILVDGGRLYIIDFDLYCEGDPALDIGNFLGHIVEYSLRTLGDPGALGDLERALEDHFVELSGESMRGPVRVYATLTLVRHVYLSTVFPERRSVTPSLLELCEERLLGAVHANE